MPLLYYIQNSITGIVLVSILLFYILGQGGIRQAQESLFVAFLLSTLLIIILELSVDIFSGRNFSGSRELLTFFTYFFYIVNPIPSALYLLYLDQLRRRWIKIPRGIGAIAFAPVLFGFLLSTISLFNGIIFSLDKQNVYQRGNLFFLITICDLLCLGFGIVYLIIHRESFKKRDFSFLLFFPFPVIIATILQVTFFGLEAVGLSLAITLLIVYLQIENTHANRDYLTSLYSRRVSEQYLQHLLNHKRKKKFVGGIMMDINNFKLVNDMYGHDLGDTCLRYFSKLLNESFKNNWFIGRFGGDEFVIFKAIDSIEELKKELAVFNKHLLDFNNKKELPFYLSQSCGYAVHAISNTMDATAFLKLLDDLMYADKREHHAKSVKEPPLSPHKM